MRLRILLFPVVAAAFSMLVGCSGFDREVSARLHKVDFLLSRSRVAEARREVQSLISRCPDRYDIRASIVSVYFRHRQWSDAAAQIEEILSLGLAGKLDRALHRDELASWYMSLGFALQNAREIERAEQAYKKALALLPENAHVMNTLAYFYAEEGLKLRDALNLARRAAARAPDNGAIIDTLGWVEYKLGRYRSAARTLARAVKLMPDDATLRYHLGAAYLQLGRVQEARIELSKALLLEPGHREADFLLRSIQKRSTVRPK
ncbi:MAG: tetratricopeptide repeat protein [Armatimonadota bacterium]|nr:tetratricopeptide repeat protein [Armatimonadota bacterium]